MKKIVLILMFIFSFSCFSQEKVIEDKKVTINYINENEFKYENILKNTENAILVYATAWCPECHKLLEDYSNLKKDLKEDVKIIVFYLPYIPSDNTLADYEKETLEFINSKNYPFESYIDKDKTMFYDLKITAVPSIGIVEKGELVNQISLEEITNEEILTKFGK